MSKFCKRSLFSVQSKSEKKYIHNLKFNFYFYSHFPLHLQASSDFSSLPLVSFSSFSPLTKFVNVTWLSLTLYFFMLSKLLKSHLQFFDEFVTIQLPSSTYNCHSSLYHSVLMSPAFAMSKSGTKTTSIHNFQTLTLKRTLVVPTNNVDNKRLGAYVNFHGN